MLLGHMPTAGKVLRCGGSPGIIGIVKSEHQPGQNPGYAPKLIIKSYMQSSVYIARVSFYWCYMRHGQNEKRVVYQVCNIVS